jgi:hypothetical protein
MNTYEKHRGVGVLLLTSYPTRIAGLSESAAADEAKDLSSSAPKHIYPEPARLGERPSESRDLSSVINPRRTLFCNQQILRERPFFIDPLPIAAESGALGHFDGLFRPVLV